MKIFNKRNLAVLLIVATGFFYCAAVKTQNDVLQCVHQLEYFEVFEQDRQFIEEGLSALFPQQQLTGVVCSLKGGLSGDRLYSVSVDNCKIVFRFIQEGWLKEWQKQCSYAEMAAQHDLGPKIIYKDQEKGFLVMEFVEGEFLTSHYLENEKLLYKLSKALHTIHHSQVPSENCRDIFAVVRFQLNRGMEKDRLAPDRIKKFLTCLDTIQAAINKRKSYAVPCHNDLHPLNVFLVHSQDISMIDWGNAGLADPFFDLANASITFALSKEQTKYFLESYFLGSVSPVDHAHFFLMQCVVLLQQGLLFSMMDDLDSVIKSLVVACFSKLEDPVECPDSSQEVGVVLLELFEKMVGSEEFKKALSVF